MDRNFAKKQILRMGQMFRFPAQVEALGELVDALLTAESEETARAVVSSFLEDATQDTPCPMASQIRGAVLERIRAEFGEVRPDPECPKCKGVGFPLSERGAGPRCSCWSRRHEPDYRKLAGAEPIGEDINIRLKQLVAAKTGGK
jgi:hypothetical protein